MLASFISLVPMRAKRELQRWCSSHVVSVMIMTLLSGGYDVVPLIMTRLPLMAVAKDTAAVFRKGKQQRQKSQIQYR